MMPVIQNVEAVILTGGASRRMGQDKASMSVHGFPSARRIADQLMAHGWPVTVLGREPLQGLPFCLDAEEFAGPLSALRGFHPSAEAVFVVSCDIPLFDGRLPGVLSEFLHDNGAAVPVVCGRIQPLCALYRTAALSSLLRHPSLKRMGDWLQTLSVAQVDEEALRRHGIEPEAMMGANTPEEFYALTNPGSPWPI